MLSDTTKAIIQAAGYNGLAVYAYIVRGIENNARYGEFDSPSGRAQHKNEYFNDGRYWMSASVRQIAEDTVLSMSQVRTSLRKLTDSGFLITGDYNWQACNRTTWYTLTEKER